MFFVTVGEDVNVGLNNAGAVLTGPLLKPILYGSVSGGFGFCKWIAVNDGDETADHLSPAIIAVEDVPDRVVAAF